MKNARPAARQPAPRTPFAPPAARRRSGRLLWIAVVLLVASCDSSNPVAPEEPDPSSGQPQTTYQVTAAASPSSVKAESDDTSTITVQVTSRATGAPPADGTKVAVNTNLGSFGTDTANLPIQLVELELAGGQASTTFFPGEETGTAQILAQLEDSSSRVAVSVVDNVPDPFFIDRVEPNFGNPDGGDQVTVLGTGFVSPVRVDFGGTVGVVLSVEAGRIQVQTPRSPQPVPVDQTLLVDVTVTNRLDEPQPQVDTLPGGFTYARGGGPINQPVIISVSPRFGPNAGGERVRVTGDGFEDPVEVLFGFVADGGGFEGVAGTVDGAVGRTGFTVITPAASGFGSALRNQQVDILVRNLDSGLSTVAIGAFRFGPELSITAVNPLSGPTAGGQTVTLTGQGFDADGGVQVELGGIVPRDGQVVSDTEIRVVTGAVTSLGCADRTGTTVVRRLGTGDSADGPAYTYSPPRPRIDGVSPTSGAQTGGTSVTLSGDGFASPATVTFGGRRAAATSVAGATRITATTPAFPDTVLLTEACDDNGDGAEGERYLPTEVDVALELSDSGCNTSFLTAFTIQPTDGSCREDAMVPEAAFSFAVSGTCDDTTPVCTVIFADESTNAPTEWEWRRDGSLISTSQTPPPVSLPSPGAYTISLTVRNGAGGSTVSQIVSLPPS